MASMFSEVKFDPRFETSNLKYPDIHVHIASGGHLGGLWGLGGLQMTSEVIFDNKIEVCNLKYPDIYVHIASDSHLGGLWGHGGLQKTSEVKADLKIELSDLNYLHSHASLACKGFFEMIDTTTTDGQLWSIDLHALPQVKMPD